MNIFFGIIIFLVIYLIFKSISLNIKAKKILGSVSTMAIDICEKKGVPIEFLKKQ